MKVKILMNDDSAKVIYCKTLKIREEGNSLELSHDGNIIGHNIKDIFLISIRTRNDSI
jgi:hypothetical protein